MKTKTFKLQKGIKKWLLKSYKAFCQKEARIYSSIYWQSSSLPRGYFLKLQTSVLDHHNCLGIKHNCVVGKKQSIEYTTEYTMIILISGWTIPLICLIWLHAIGRQMASFKPTSFFLLISVLNSSVVNYKSLQIIHKYFSLVVVVEEKDEGQGGRGRAAERVVWPGFYSVEP